MNNISHPENAAAPSTPTRPQPDHCPLCGAKNLQSFNFCQSCGQPLPWSTLPPPQQPMAKPTPAPPAAPALNMQRASDEPAGLALILICFFIPIVGFVVWVALLAGTQHKKARDIGWTLLASILLSIVAIPVLTAFVSSPFKPTIPTPTATTRYQPDLPNINDLQLAPTPPKTEQSANDIAPTNDTAIASTPTGIDSNEPLDGERFPQARMREMTASEIADLSSNDLRYAINEMYARYGMTFKDKNYQSNFNGLKWYRPNDRWTPEQIEKVFTVTERRNLAALIQERANRQNWE